MIDKNRRYDNRDDRNRRSVFMTCVDYTCIQTNSRRADPTCLFNSYRRIPRLYLEETLANTRHK